MLPRNKEMVSTAVAAKHIALCKECGRNLKPVFLDREK
jgi:hypothetical protein